MADKKPSCLKCKYFIQLYRWHVDRYVAILYGYCKYEMNELKIVKKPFRGCKFWELNELTEERKENFKKQMLEMANRIEHILKRLEV